MPWTNLSKISTYPTTKGVTNPQYLVYLPVELRGCFWCHIHDTRRFSEQESPEYSIVCYSSSSRSHQQHLTTQRLGQLHPQIQLAIRGHSYCLWNDLPEETVTVRAREDKLTSSFVPGVSRRHTEWKVTAAKPRKKPHKNSSFYYFLDFLQCFLDNRHVYIHHHGYQHKCPCSSSEDKMHWTWSDVTKVSHVELSWRSWKVTKQVARTPVDALRQRPNASRHAFRIKGRILQWSKLDVTQHRI